MEGGHGQDCAWGKVAYDPACTDYSEVVVWPQCDLWCWLSIFAPWSDNAHLSCIWMRGLSLWCRSPGCPLSHLAWFSFVFSSVKERHSFLLLWPLTRVRNKTSSENYAYLYVCKGLCLDSNYDFYSSASFCSLNDAKGDGDGCYEEEVTSTEPLGSSECLPAPTLLKECPLLACLLHHTFKCYSPHSTQPLVAWILLMN